MAVRKNVFYKVGGFNVDNFANPKYIWLSGDAECGLEDKIYEAGYKIVYEPRAWLYHRIPASRLTPHYFNQRLFFNGVMDSYIRIRKMKDNRMFFLKLFTHSARYFLKAIYKYMKSILQPKNQVRHRADAYFWWAKGEHHFRTLLSRGLRKHVLQDSYL